MATDKSVFATLNDINVNGRVEKKNNLTYLSWAWAWAEVKKAFPEAVYKIYENEHGWNYFTDGRSGWVKTGVTIEGIEHIEYLPIMDYKNKSIPADSIMSTDVNKTIQRSLTKACARHGLGLYIYAGEDLPEIEDDMKKKTKDTAKTTIKDIEAKALETRVKNAHKSVSTILKYYSIQSLSEMTYEQYDDACRQLQAWEKDNGIEG